MIDHTHGALALLRKMLLLKQGYYAIHGHSMRHETLALRNAQIERASELIHELGEKYNDCELFQKQKREGDLFDENSNP